MSQLHDADTESGIGIIRLWLTSNHIRGQRLFKRVDIERCIEIQKTKHIGTPIREGAP
jgi:hypothetical protein